MDFYKVSTINAAGANLNIFYDARDNNDQETVKVLFKLSDLPCFQNKMYWPLFLTKGAI